MLPQNILYYGRPDPLPDRLPLQAGCLSLFYQGGDLWAIKLGDREVVRRIYPAVRDQNWRTPPRVITHLETQIAPTAFRLRYEATSQQADVDFVWEVEIIGSADSQISFQATGKARSDFWRNRIGLCILHPIETCAGKPAWIETPQGQLIEGMFPSTIAPQQPFIEMQSLRYEVAPGIQAELRFTGDMFELEDQRNWTDASYKTYSTPLSLPMPVFVPAGTTVQQSVAIKLLGDVPALVQPAAPEIHITIDPTVSLPLPRIGLSLPPSAPPLTQRELDRLKALHLAHLRLELNLASNTWRSQLEQASQTSLQLNVPLEIALTLSDAGEQELTAFTEAWQEYRPSVCTWLIFHQTEQPISHHWLALARQALLSLQPEAKFGSGTSGYFVDLNRNRPSVELLNLVAYSLTPQVHAFDHRSIVENLAGQTMTIASAQAFTQPAQLAIGPITLKPRSKTNLPANEQPPTDQLPAAVDPRQLSLLGAGWTLGSLKALTQPGVYSLTYYETIGWQGVMETESGSPLPQQFPSLPGAVFPLYHSLAEVGEWRDAQMIAAHSSHPLQVEVLALQQDSQCRLLIANLTEDPQTVTLSGLSGQVQLRHLDERSAEWAMTQPEAFRASEGEVRATDAGTLRLELLPYAIVRCRTLPD